MKTERQDTILEIISARRVGTQEKLAKELLRRGIIATQSSVSRDIVELGLTKMNGYYTAPQPVMAGGPVFEVETAGDCLIVIKTGVGQASSAALAIDRARIEEVVGTVAGDDTMFVAVKNIEAQRAAMKKIIKLFAPPVNETKRAQRRPARSNARTL